MKKILNKFSTVFRSLSIKYAREFQIVKAGIASLALSVVLIYLIKDSQSSLESFLSSGIGGVLKTIFAAFLTSPIAFVLWRFRDINQRDQIENQRKDVNLKDFHRVCEWASGLHLAEYKIINTKKAQTESDKLIEVSVSSESHNETLTSEENLINRRQSGLSLQISAVYQLKAYIDGEYGAGFRKPALMFALSLWKSLIIGVKKTFV